ncbi:STAS domain-containing protein [Actinoplanes sp. NPDC051346]|uniref:STAS domain-containing protein n=1 Tax=Actinoplanes sp. NPDC051346 TaxID=3155048 RepID=UPI0034407A1C
MEMVSIGAGSDAVVDVVLRGVVDFSNAGPAAVTVKAAIAERRPAVVRVDLSAVTFLDSSGLGLLVQAMKAADAVGAAFRVEHAGEKVFDTLRMTGLLEAFGMVQPPAAE